MDIQIIDSKSTVAASDAVFARDYNETLVHQVVTAYRNAARAGTKAQKNRSDVSGGGIKPWRQKGTGRARAGSIRSPIWRTGGTTFAARPRDFSQKVNKKMYQAALQTMLSQLVRENRLHAVKDFGISEPKTKLLASKIKDWKLEGRVLLVTDELDSNLLLAARNIHQVRYCTAKQVGPLDLVMAQQVIISEAALKQLEERFK